MDWPPRERRRTPLEHAFGPTLRALRNKRGLSQEQLGFDTGYHRTYISLLERGINSPSLGTLERLATVLGLNTSALIAHVEQTAKKKERLGTGEKPRRTKR